MLRLALIFELRMLIRRRAGLAALLAFLATGALAVTLGQGQVGEWQDAVDRAQTAQSASVTQARALLSAGEKGPSESPWIDLAAPMWQDRYAGTRVTRTPGPLAGIAAGSVDPAPVAFHVHRRADPYSAGGYRIENPELASGAVDLIFVLSVLTPLLIGVLGLGIGGHEREERIDRLVIIQSGSLQSWLVARMIAVSAIAGLAVLLLCLGAGLTGGASLSELGALAGLGLVYTALWGGLLLVVSARSRSVRAGAFAFGSLWTVLCVLLPTLGAEVGLGRLQADYALSETLEARALTYDAYEQELGEATEQLYALYPELSTMQAAADQVLAPAARRHVYDGLLVAGLSERHRDRAAQAVEAQQVAQAVAWLSPPVALTLALERLAGVGPDAASAYASYLVEAVEARVEWLLLQTWGGRSLGLPEFDALIAQSPAPFEWRPVGLLGPSLLLGAWLLLGWVIGARSLRQSEQPG